MVWKNPKPGLLICTLVLHLCLKLLKPKGSFTHTLKMGGWGSFLPLCDRLSMPIKIVQIGSRLRCTYYNMCVTSHRGRANNAACSVRQVFLLCNCPHSLLFKLTTSALKTHCKCTRSLQSIKSDHFTFWPFFLFSQVVRLTWISVQHIWKSHFRCFNAC